MANLRPLDGPQQQPPTAATSSSVTAGSSASSSMPNNNLSSFYGFNNHSNNNNLCNNSGIGNDYHDPNLSDDEPIYDPVADDDYEPMPPMAQQVNLMRQKILKLNNSFG